MSFQERRKKWLKTTTYILPPPSNSSSQGVKFADLITKNIEELLDFANENKIETEPDLEQRALLYNITKELVNHGTILQVDGCLDIPTGYNNKSPNAKSRGGFIRFAENSYCEEIGDPYIPVKLIRNLKLRAGDNIQGTVRIPEAVDKNFVIARIDSINGCAVKKHKQRKLFKNYTAIDPDEIYNLEIDLTDELADIKKEEVENKNASKECKEEAADLIDDETGLCLSDTDYEKYKKLEKKAKEHRKQGKRFEDGRVEIIKENITGRIINLFAPIGKGQRAILLAPPKCGKTVMLQNIAKALNKNHPEVQLFVLLIDERPEEVTNMKRSVAGEVVASTFDETSEHHVQVAEMVIEKAKRQAELGKDTVVLLDSITRLTYATQATSPNTGKGALSGGVDAAGLRKAKQLFGAARNLEDGGSLTIIATALDDPNSKMDTKIYDEFKGTGNCDIVLRKYIANKHVFPAILLQDSGTRNDHKILDAETHSKSRAIRKNFVDCDHIDCIETMIEQLCMEVSNKEFLDKHVDDKYNPFPKSKSTKFR